MASWYWVILGFSAALCGVSLIRGAVMTVLRPRLTLRPSGLPPGGDWESLPDVHVVIPARNEQRDLGRCLDAVLGQAYPKLRVTVVNDRSEDGTASVAARYAERDSRVQLLEIRQLPAGWTGKAHAMWSAVPEVEAEWLLFIDVDVTLDPDAVHSAVREAARRQVDFLTIYPRAAANGFWPQVAIPFLGSLLVICFDPLRVNSRHSRMGFINGQFLLMRREVYLRLDGHRAVRDFLIEDIPFGQLAKRERVPGCVLAGPDIAQVQMYDGLAAIVRGFSRIFIGGLRSRLKLAGLFLVLVAALWPLVVMLGLAASWLAGRVDWTAAVPWQPLGRLPGCWLSGQQFWLLAGLGGLQLLAALWFNFHVWGSSRLSRWWLLLYPLSVLVAGYTLVQAFRGFHRVQWRGMDYRVGADGRLVAASGPSA